MAKRLGIAVHGGMRKEELVSVVAKASRDKSGEKSKAGRTKAGVTSKTGGRTKRPSSKKSLVEHQNGTSKSAKQSPSAKSSSSKSGRTRSSSAKSAGPVAKAKTAVGGSVGKAGSSSRSRKPGTAKKDARSSPDRKLTSSKNKAASRSKGSQDVAPKRERKTSATKVAPAKKVVAEKKKSVPKPKPTNPKILKRIRELQLQRDSDKNIAFRPTLVKPSGAPEPIWEKEPRKDRVALFVRDAYWMHVSWDITRQAIERAKSAMAEQWHSAKPIIRLLRLDGSGTTSTSETIERDIEIHGGLRNWYIDWNGESANFRAMIGYLTPQGRFHCICESNTVQTPGAGTSEAIDEHWSGVGPESEKIFALSGGYDPERDTSDLQEMLEERLHRNLGAPALARLGAGADGPFARRNDFYFEMDLELVLFGSTVPDGYLTLNGEPVALREDGTFVLRLPFPDRRQVLPAVSCSRDGSQQRTIVVAVERNTKIMEPLEMEQDTGE